MSAHPKGTTRWKDSDGYIHLILAPSTVMEMQFEGHPTSVDILQLVLRLVDTTRHKASGRAAYDLTDPAGSAK